VDANGVANKGTQDFLKNFADAFADWIGKF